jgi:hypothetical protein
MKERQIDARDEGSDMPHRLLHVADCPYVVAMLLCTELLVSSPDLATSLAGRASRNCRNCRGPVFSAKA